MGTLSPSKNEGELPCFDQILFFDLNIAVGERIMISSWKVTEF